MDYSKPVLTHQGEKFVFLNGQPMRFNLGINNFYFCERNGGYINRDWRDAAQFMKYADENAKRVIKSQGDHFRKMSALSVAKSCNFEPECPEGVSFLDYQKAGIYYGTLNINSGKKGVLLCDQMGLGKSGMAIGIQNHFKPKTILIVCPKSLKENWARELKMWLTYDLEIHYVETFLKQGCINIINYERLSKLTLRSYRFIESMIIDEAQEICNGRDTIKGSMVMDIAKTCRYVQAITGTPIGNNAMEFFPMLNIVDGFTWNNRMDFGYKYCKWKKTKGEVKFTGGVNLDELRERARGSCMVRRVKNMVLDLPAKHRTIIPVNIESSKEFMDVSEKLEKAYLEYKNTSVLNEEKHKQAIENLRSAKKIAMSQMSRERKNIGLAKIPLAKEFIRELMDKYGKVVVFAHHQSVISALSNEFKGISVSITGKTPEADRMRNVDSFQNDEKTKLFFGSIRSSGAGLNLTASNCVLFVEFDWNPARMNQSEDRTHRIGQTKDVHIFMLAANGTLDSKIMKTIMMKQEIADKALDFDSYDEVALELSNKEIVKEVFGVE